VYNNPKRVANMWKRWAAFIASILWFVVRVYLKQPDVPAFSSYMALPDSLFAIIGIVGLVSILLDFFQNHK
jgi:hypothetical protein